MQGASTLFVITFFSFYLTFWYNFGKIMLKSKSGTFCVLLSFQRVLVLLFVSYSL